MKSKNIIYYILSITLVTACASTPPSSVEESYNKTEVSFDEFSKTRIVKGAHVTITFGLDGGGGLRMRKVNDSYQIYINTFSQLGWCFFESAYEINAGQLAFVKNNSNVGRGGITYEEFYLTPTQSQLSLIEKNGFHARIYGKNRTIDVKLSAKYIQGFLKKVNE